MSDIKPTRQELQIEHRCCACGQSLFKVYGYETIVCATIAVVKGDIVSAHRIAWCDTCWSKVPGKDPDCNDTIDILRRGEETP